MRYRIASTGNGAQWTITRLSDGATLCLQGDDAIKFDLRLARTALTDDEVCDEYEDAFEAASVEPTAMTLEEIKQAVADGQTVHWSNEGYEVVKDELGQWFIKCNQNSHCIGLTHQDGVTMNGQPEEFFITDEMSDDEFSNMVDKLALEPLALRRGNLNAGTIYLDLPLPVCCDTDADKNEKTWVNVAKFTDPAEAVAFVREHIDPYCDEQGRISILTNMPETPAKNRPDAIVETLKGLLEELDNSGLSSMPGDTFAGLVACVANAREAIAANDQPSGGTITIEISGGCLTDVSGLPDGWNYELIDHDDRNALVQELSHERCVELLTPTGLTFDVNDTVEVLRRAVEQAVYDEAIDPSEIE